MMIPDSHRRLEKAYAELKALVDAEEAEMAEAKEFQEGTKTKEESAISKLQPISAVPAALHTTTTAFALFTWFSRGFGVDFV